MHRIKNFLAVLGVATYLSLAGDALAQVKKVLYEPRTKKVVGYLIYEVRPGETLSEIAYRWAGVPWADNKRVMPFSSWQELWKYTKDFKFLVDDTTSSRTWDKKNKIHKVLQIKDPNKIYPGDLIRMPLIEGYPLTEKPYPRY